MPPPGTALRDDAVIALVPAIRRAAEARVRDRETAEDITQETVTRLLAVSDRLDPDAMLPYALGTARNLAASLGRDQQRWRRHMPRLVDTRAPDAPDELVVRREEEAAVRAALSSLTPQDRQAVLSHELDGTPTAEMAGTGGSSPGAVAARLARSRAKLRVNYVLALRRVELPTERCRPVLLALSAGDRRRQRVLRAGGHLLDCRVCSSLGEVFVQRRSSLAGLLPWVVIGPLGSRLVAPLRHRTVQAAGLTTAVVAAGVYAVGATSDMTPPPPAPVTVSAETVAPRQAPVAVTLPLDRITPGATGSLRQWVGRAVTGREVAVVAVSADEGFWVAGGSQTRVWVQLVTGGESPQRVQVGDRVSFTGTVAANPPGFAEATGVTVREGAARLDAAEAHVLVDAGALRIG